MKSRLILIGGGTRAPNTLQSILQRCDIEVVLIVAMPGHSDEVGYAHEICQIAAQHEVECLLADKADSTVIRRCRAAKPDAILGIGVWRALLPIELIRIPPWGYLSLHGTPLPHYRGWAGISWQIINGEQKLRMRAFRLGEGVDDGDIVCWPNGEPFEYSIDIDNEFHLAEIFLEYEKVHIKATHDLIDGVVNRTLNFVPQDSSDVTVSCNRNPSDGEIDWRLPTTNVFNFVRGQSYPYPGAFTYFKGHKIRVWRARPRPDFGRYVGRIPGKVVERGMPDGSVIVLTGDSGLQILEASLQGQPSSPPRNLFDSVRERCKSRVEACADFMGFV